MPIHFKIIKSLLISSSVIALIVALITLAIQLNQIEDKVLALSKNEVKYLIKSLQLQESSRQINLDLKHSHFLSLSLFDTKQERLFHSEVDSFAQIKKELTQIDHHLVLKSQNDVQEKVIHNQIQNRFYFYFHVPLVTPKFKGFISGYYQISDKELKDIYLSIFYSILQLIVTVFVTALLLYPMIIYLNRKYMEQSENLLHANLEIMSVLGGAIAKRDNETNAHNYRVTLYAIAFAEALHLDKTQMMGLIKGAFLHDVGKIGIPDAILLKPDKLNEKEFETMKYHVSYGIEIISKSRWLDDAKDVVAYHHEKFDGSGYNRALIARQIPLNARIFAICDVFDALSSKRPYKKSFSFEKSVQIIQDGASTHFDPELVAVFLRIITPLYQKIAQLEDEDALQKMLKKKLYYLDA